MIYVQCPDDYALTTRSIFMAGGISGCDNWQYDLAEMLRDADVMLINPRKQNFDTSDPLAARAQIEWEYKNMMIAHEILFWFPCETLCPITLYELGRWSASQKKLYVGVHPDYKRKQDVEIQLALARPDIQIVYRLPDLANQISPP